MHFLSVFHGLVSGMSALSALVDAMEIIENSTNFEVKLSDFIGNISSHIDTVKNVSKTVIIGVPVEWDVVKVTFIVFIALVCFIGFIAHLLIVFGIASHSSKLTSFDVLVANTSVIDMAALGLVVSWALTIQVVLGNKWPFGLTACHAW